MSVERDSNEYNMSHPRRGKAVIFNHDTFNIDGINPRLGSDVDVKNLVQTYESLGFQSVVYNNLTFAEIKTEINNCESLSFLVFSSPLLCL